MSRSLDVALLAFLSAGVADAQLPATAPTQLSPANGMTAPIAGTSTGADARSRAHRAQVTCDGGQLVVHAENSSLNQILRSIAACTGMRITGGVADQRVFGTYGPAEPSTVLATLLDGTGSNMLLRETALNQPAELILTPRTGGPTPPPPASYGDTDEGEPNQANAAQGTPQGQNQAPNMMMRGPRNLMGPPQAPPNSGTASGSTASGAPTSGPASIPQPTNNVNGSPSNTSPTASTYPTTNSVPIDSVRTPSTTPSSTGIVDAPNPPVAGSDTATMMNGSPAGTPGTTNINPAATSGTTTPGGTNTTTPASGTPTPGTNGGAVTPEQIYQQLQQMQQQKQQQQQPGTPPS